MIRRLVIAAEVLTAILFDLVLIVGPVLVALAYLLAALLSLLR